jgi:hypothetical protein
VLITGSWLLGGGYADAWAHNHFALDSFFTPWHGILYSGGLAATAFVLGAVAVNWLRGYALPRSFPAGYGLTLLGVIFFICGGVGDLIWHSLFGIEKNIEAALSPTHLYLSLAFGLLVSGPLRSMWYRRTAFGPGLFNWLPLLVSIALTMASFTLITQILHPAVRIYAGPGYRSQSDIMLGVLSIILQTLIFMGVVLLTLRRWSLPFGSLTVILLLTIVPLSFMQDHFLAIPVAALAGLLSDALLYLLKPSAQRPGAFHLFAFAMPTVTFILYFLTLMLTTGIWWTVHVWAGSIAIAGLTGWLLSYLVVPPAIPVYDSCEEEITPDLPVEGMVKKVD